MKILVTGKTGQVGYELTRSLQGLGQIVSVDLAEMDLTKLDQVRDVIRTVKPNLIINPAAYTAVDQAEKEPALAMKINGEAPAVMAEEAKKLGAAMIHYSTDYVFDGSKMDAYTEDDKPNPMNVYGQTKLAGEQAVSSAGIPHLIFRTSWVYGMRGKNFLLTVLRLAQERDELRIVADQRGAPTWCRTLADVTAHVVARAGISSDAAAWLQQYSGLYHLTAQGQTTWHGFTEAILQNAALPKKTAVTAIATSEYPTPARRPVNSVLSCQRLIDTFCTLPAWDEALTLCMEK
ncbi:MAG: dTDP-4-dehydrorhamnose reductase [Burkholderiales bacterium]|nr:dTDP-4-dehydrorhamnose reductase [Burkholderiales bacterium]